MQRLGHRFERALHVGLQHDVERRRLAPRDLLEEVLELGPGSRGHGPVARQPEALRPGLTERAGPGQVLGRPHLVAGVWRLREAQHLHRRRRQRLLDVIAPVVDQRLDLAPGGPGHNRVADTRACPCCTITVATGPRPASRLASSTTPRASPSTRAVSSSTSATITICSSRPSMFVPCSAETSTTMVSPPQASGTSPRSDSCWSTRDESASGRSILLTATMIGTSAALAWSMASIVWGITPSSAATTRMTMSVACGPAGPHGGEGGVARGVDERDAVVLPDHLVGADVLGDAAGLSGHDVGRADAVEQQRLAVVDVAHDGDDRRARPLVLLVLLVLLVEVAGQELGLLLLAGVDQAHVGADLGGEQLDHVVGQRLGRHDHLALQEQEAHDVTGAAVQLRARGRGPSSRAR